MVTVMVRLDTIPGLRLVEFDVIVTVSLVAMTPRPYTFASSDPKKALKSAIAGDEKTLDPVMYLHKKPPVAMSSAYK